MLITTLSDLHHFIGKYEKYIPTLSERELLPELNFSNNFNESLDHINFPDCIRHITFGRSFNQSFKYVKFPSKLKILEINGVYNQPLDDVEFPDSLIIIAIGGWFNHSLDKVKFPANLQDFSLRGKFEKSLENVLFPVGLEILEVSCLFTGPLPSLPDTVKHLVVDGSSDICLDTYVFPTNLLSLNLGDFFSDQSLKQLPDSLEVLNLGRKFLGPLLTIPKNVYDLGLSVDYELQIKDEILAQLKFIKVSEKYPFLPMIYEQFPSVRVQFLIK